MLELTVEDFLKHHGVKGQHWGIRNVKQEMTSLKNKINKNKKLKVGLEIGAGIAAAGAIAAGAVFAHKMLLQHQAMKATDLRTLWGKGKPWLIPPVSSKVLSTPVSSLPKHSGGSILSTIRGIKPVERRLDKTALKSGSPVTTADVNQAVSNIGKATYQTARSTKRKDVVNLLKSVRIGVGPA